LVLIRLVNSRDPTKPDDKHPALHKRNERMEGSKGIEMDEWKER
jgi:hypothetical protein